MARRLPRDRFPRLNLPVTIAGGGLAGLSLAIALRRREIPVTILEAGSYPRHRVCGEFISGTSLATLENLGIARHFDDVLRHRTIVWRDRGNTLHRDLLPEPALGISRHTLDQRLREDFETAGGLLKTHTRARPEPREGLVWAAGRRPATGSPWIGLKLHCQGIPMEADLEMHSGSNGYCGLTPVGDGWINVCGLFKVDRRLPSKGPDLLPAYLTAGGNEILAGLIRTATPRDGSFTAVAGFQLGRQPAIPGLLAIGDAESMIPPFTGNGMSMAFQAAEIALRPLLEWSEGQIPWHAAQSTIASRLAGRFRFRTASARLLHHLLLSRGGRDVLRSLSRARVLPFRPALRLVR